MRRLGLFLFILLAVAVSVPLLGRLVHRSALSGESPHKVFVVLGFHTNFYHSWRGDTPDEAGFGTDIRIVREILRILDEANAAGLDARGYWESDVQFTLESILPKHAPDIIDALRRRVELGYDEILVAPYNNGFFSAMTEEEVRASLRWAVTNPWGSGVADLFGAFTPVVRPQEAMFTPGLIEILLDEGMDGLILPYSTYPFTSFSNFVPPLPPEQRFGLTWLRTETDGPRIALFPSVSPGDIIDFVSLEKWMLNLREMQIDGRVDSDLVIHINFDADAESWLPLPLPFGLRWLPNTGGLQEYIDAVNKYPWAQFTTPGEFMKDRTPVGEVILRQDTADGAWDGYYSWSEKYDSHEVWTAVQQSRLYEQQARTIAANVPGDPIGALHETYFAGPQGSFLQRIRSLSTTHFGMSTPMVNDERYAAAMAAAGGARRKAESALASAARARVLSLATPLPDALYSIELHDIVDAPADLPLRIPLLLPKPIHAVDVVDALGEQVPFSITNALPLDGPMVVELLLPAHAARRPQPIAVQRAMMASPPAAQPAVDAPTQLANERVRLILSPANGVDSFVIDGESIGGPEFLSAFLSYKVGDVPDVSFARDWIVEIPEGERFEWVQRARLRTHISMRTQSGNARAELEITFTLPAQEPYVIADISIVYPYTEKRDVLATPQQKLRKLVDRRWVEVAPFQLHPDITNEDGDHLKVWRSNYLGRVAAFDLDYAEINPKNANLDSFNHQVTADWVAVAGGGKGLLLAQDASVRSSANFAPMRLRTMNGSQRLWINPFGSYFGEQMDYSHMGGAGLGRDLAVMIGPAFRPNGPSYNGRSERFSLLLGPYLGDEPPAELQAAARAFFAPPPVLFLRTPAGVDARIPNEMNQEIAQRRQAAARSRDAALALPRAFLASASDGAVDLVWDESPDLRVDGHDVQWRVVSAPEWEEARIDAGHRHRVLNLVNGTKQEFRIRCRFGDQTSEWTESQSVVVGPVGEQSVLTFVEGVEPDFLWRLLRQILVHAITVP